MVFKATTSLYKLRVVAYETENRWVLRWDWKTATEGVEVTCWGRLFQTRAAATGKPVHRRWIEYGWQSVMKTRWNEVTDEP